MKTIAEQIKAARSFAGLSQAQAALAWGIQKSTLQQWEQERRIPRGDAWEALRAKLAAPAARPRTANRKKPNK